MALMDIKKSEFLLVTKMVPLTVLCTSLLVTLAIGVLSNYNFQQRAESRYKNITTDIFENIHERMHDHEMILLGAKGLCNARPSVSRAEFKNYVNSLRLDENRPGILGIGYSAWLSPLEKEATITAVRAEGFTEYDIKPGGVRPRYTGITLIEPFNWRNRRSFGYDMYTEPVRRGAMDRALDSGSVVLTGKLTLLQETEQDKQVGLIMYAPVYQPGVAIDTVEARRTAMRGFVYSPIRIKDYIYGTFGTIPKEVSFDIYIGGVEENNLLFSSMESENVTVPKGYLPDYSSKMPFSYYGITGYIVFKTLPSFTYHFATWLTNIILVAGIVTSLLLTLYARKRQNQLLAVLSNETRLTNIIHGTNAGTWEWNVQTGAVAINERWAHIIGYTYAELEPISIDTWVSFTHPEDLEQSRLLLEKHYKEPSEPYHCDVRMKHKDGNWIWVSDWGSVTRWSDDGKPLIMQGVHIDISGPKQIELDLHHANSIADKSNKLLYAIVDTMSDWLWEIDANARVVYCSPQVVEHLGYSPEEIIGKTPYDFMHPAEAARVAEAFRKISLEKGRFSNMEQWILAKDGTSILFSSNGVPIVDEEGRIQGYRGVNKNITNQYYNESRLKKLSYAVEKCPSPILITDREGVIEFVNESFTTLTGYSETEAIGQNPRFIKSGEMTDEFYTSLWKTISGGNTWKGELHNRRKDGSLYWVQSIIAPLHDAQGVISHYVSIKEDITEKRVLAEQLLHAQKAETVGALAGGLAHELNNILSIIGGYTLLLKKSCCLEPKQQQYLTEIATAVNDAGAITHGMLAYSRKQNLNLGCHDLVALVKAAGVFIEQVLREDIIVSKDLPEQPIFVLCDPQLIKQVLINLATNARDAMPNGGGLHITVGTFSCPGTEEGVNAQITVTDDGEGMDEFTQKRIFDPFFTTKEVGKGTGLGMPVVFGIITQHRGTITVQSELGKGTTFRLQLPVISAAVTSDVTDGTITCLDTVIKKAGSLLVVDDNEKLGKVISEYLSDAGYHVILAVDGADAYEKFMEYDEKVSLIITDVIMPNKNGKALFDEICIHSNVPFIFMSGHQQEIINSQGDFGTARVLLKPINLAELLDVVGATIC